MSEYIILSSGVGITGGKEDSFASHRRKMTTTDKLKEHLEKKVNSYLKKGYKPVGGVCLDSNGDYIQAVAK